MINEYIVAERLYTAYCAAVGGKAFNGDSLPTWREFHADPTKQKQALAWLDTARAAMNLLLG